MHCSYKTVHERVAQCGIPNLVLSDCSKRQVVRGMGLQFQAADGERADCPPLSEDRGNRRIAGQNNH